MNPKGNTTVKLLKIKDREKSLKIFPPSIHYEVMEPDDMIFCFWMLSFKPAFSLSSKELDLSVVMDVAEAYSVGLFQ